VPNHCSSAHPLFRAALARHVTLAG